jgi:hypothetical protein
VAGAKVALQVEPQLMPPTSEVTVPEPVLLTDSVYLICVKVAATDLADDNTMVHMLVPAQPPPVQPVKVYPLEATALSSTLVPDVNDALHVLPQSMPAGADVTEPEPVSTTFSARVFAATGVNEAPTERAPDITTLQAPVPLQAPVQPVNW